MKPLLTRRVIGLLGELVGFGESLSTKQLERLKTDLTKTLSVDQATSLAWVDAEARRVLFELTAKERGAGAWRYVQ